MLSREQIRPETTSYFLQLSKKENIKSISSRKLALADTYYGVGVGVMDVLPFLTQMLAL